jgi:hypothetical protein
MFLPEQFDAFSLQSHPPVMSTLAAGLGSHQDFLIGDMRGWSPLRDKHQIEVVDDSIHHGIVGEESDNPYCAAALRAERGVNLIDLVDHLGPAWNASKM